ncbi:tyrosine-type recombinase/integrase [Telluribacter humicola]|uniref:tyrosine-type recombinase/integrase n=1 Tax=Telluribacter humicola TaxID=1720261 RepID=UPI001A95C076|nr:site-specific integrase [Telluribacter humicola]
MKTFVGLRVRTDYVKKNGRSQLYLSIGINKEYDKLDLELDWPADHVDKDNNRLLPLVKGDKECNDNNLIIRNAMGRVNDIFVEYRLKEKELTMGEFFKMYHEYEKRKDFILYMEAKIKERYSRKKISDGTRKSHENSLIWLRKFKAAIAFKDLNKKFIESLEAWLQKQENRRSNSAEKLDKNTIANVMKYIRAYINLAIDDDDVPIENPYKKAKVTTHQDEKLIEHLMPTDVAILMDYYEQQLPIGEKLTLCRFLVACLLSLRISDILKLDAERVNYYKIVGKLIFHPKKQVRTRKLKTVYVHIDETAQYYLDELVELLWQARSQGLNISESYGRKTLRKISQKTGVKVSGFHTGRHTFATNYLRAGGWVTNLQHIMGHTNINTTMKYVHIVEEDNEEHMTQLSRLYNKFRKGANASDPKSKS